MSNIPVQSTEPCLPCEFRGDLGKTVLNSLTAHIAILNQEGVIIETNRAWQGFARNVAGQQPTSHIGVNYLAVCDAVQGHDLKDAQTVAAGIRAVLRGLTAEFLYDYPCHFGLERHWFYMRALRMDGADPLRVVISHEEITQLKLAEQALIQGKAALEEQKQRLEETNIALKVLLNQRAADKQELEQTVLTNIKDLVLPYVEKLKISPLRPKDKTLVEILESHLHQIVSPLLYHLANIHLVLTPQEIQVAFLVKDGRSTKEIAEILGLSETTVHFHRKNLRRKFGIKNSAANLRTHLMSIS